MAKPKKLTSAPPVLDQKLTDQLSSLRLLTKTHNLLTEGTYRLGEMQGVHQCMTFVATLHSSLMEEALAHPDSDKVDELLKYKEKVAFGKRKDAMAASDRTLEGAKNGQAQKQ